MDEQKPTALRPFSISDLLETASHKAMLCCKRSRKTHSLADQPLLQLYYYRAGGRPLMDNWQFPMHLHFLSLTIFLYKIEIIIYIYKLRLLTLRSSNMCESSQCTLLCLIRIFSSRLLLGSKKHSLFHSLTQGLSRVTISKYMLTNETTVLSIIKLFPFHLKSFNNLDSYLFGKKKRRGEDACQ
jgi:hypothetical protein